MQAQEKWAQALLKLLQRRLESAGLWQTALLPSPEAFESNEPFCVDQMTMPQWLRYVFIPRMQALIDQRGPLPQACDITSQCEMQMQGAGLAAVLEVTQALDQLLTAHKIPSVALMKASQREAAK
ncbi:YqcC family protein [Marinospirillum sp.]|uniref:YqcC family protein n=1 Tax=Marinospirillum sp. TaxID=2183934 RepID=UPI003A8A7177